MASRNPFCFVIGPIGKDDSDERKHSDLLLNAIIRDVLQRDEFGYHVRRADEDADPGMIGDRIISNIINADLVIADLTGLNANVFYELGIRHATEKSTIHMARTGTSLPFDNIAHRTIFVDLSDWHSIEDARIKLAKSIRATKESGYKVSNPITQANASFAMRQSEDPRDQLVAEMQERITRLESAISTPIADDAPSLSQRIRDALNYEGRIGAIRLYREITGASLKDAKDFIEALESRPLEAARIHQRITRVSSSEAIEFVKKIDS